MHLVNMLTEADSELNAGGIHQPVPDIYRASDHPHMLCSVHHTDSSLLTDKQLYQNTCLYFFTNETRRILFLPW